MPGLVDKVKLVAVAEDHRNQLLCHGDGVGDNLIIVKQNMQGTADCFAAAASGYFSPHLFWEKVLKHNGKKYTPTSTG